MAPSGLIKHEGTSEIAIFASLLKADDGNLSRGLARYILTLGFDDDDQARNWRKLASRNQEEDLGADQREELQNYVKAGHLVALLRSKARRSLKPKKRPEASPVRRQWRVLGGWKQQDASDFLDGNMARSAPSLRSANGSLRHRSPPAGWASLCLAAARRVAR